MITTHLITRPSKPTLCGRRQRGLDTIYPDVYAILKAMAKEHPEVEVPKLCRCCALTFVAQHKERK